MWFKRKEPRWDRKRRREEEHARRLPTDDEPELPPPVDPVEAEKTPGRNEPCPCDSGKKYKKCCGANK